MQVLQAALVGGAIYLAHLDRLKNVVGNRYKSVHLGGKVYIITGSNTGIGESFAGLLQSQGLVVYTITFSFPRV